MLWALSVSPRAPGSAAMLIALTNLRTDMPDQRQTRSRRASSVDTQVDLLESGRLMPPTAISRWLV
jgi:hypothetical protein